MTDEELRDLIERVHQIQELQKHQGWELLLDYSRALLAHKQGRILSGKLTPDEYHEAVGWLNGANAILNAAEVLAERLERAKDLEQTEQEEERDAA